MKKFLPLIFLFIFNLCIGQEEPLIKFANSTSIVGTCDYGSVVHYNYKDATGAIIEDSSEVTNGNSFVIMFKVPQKVDDKGKIWATYKNFKLYTVTTDKKDYTVISDAAAVNIITSYLSKNESDYVNELAKINEFKAEKDALKNTTLTYRNTIWSTNFSIPLVRFNFVEGDDKKQGDILLFNSIGAGIGWYKGRLERTRDNNGEIVNEEFSNSWGFNLGALFSAGTGEDSKNVFAPVINFSALDFQVGVGVELGTLTANQKREFITLSYAIPLYKLFKRSYRVTRGNRTPIESSRKTQG
jgi:hypothetical protein